MWPAAWHDGSLFARRRWFDATLRTWRNGRGRTVRWPDLVETAQIRHTRVVLAATRLDHNPGNNRHYNLKSLCQRCHMIHDRPHHLAQRRVTYLLRRAFGDLFLGPYRRGWCRSRRAFRDGQTACRARSTLPESHDRIRGRRLPACVLLAVRDRLINVIQDLWISGIYFP
jgi:hypothetical protein